MSEFTVSVSVNNTCRRCAATQTVYKNRLCMVGSVAMETITGTHSALENANKLSSHFWQTFHDQCVFAIFVCWRPNQWESEPFKILFIIARLQLKIISSKYTSDKSGTDDYSDTNFSDCMYGWRIRRKRTCFHAPQHLYQQSGRHTSVSLSCPDQYSSWCGLDLWLESDFTGSDIPSDAFLDTRAQILSTDSPVTHKSDPVRPSREAEVSSEGFCMMNVKQ